MIKKIMVVLAILAFLMFGALGMQHLMFGDIPGNYIWPELGACHICGETMYAWQSCEKREFGITVIDQFGNEIPPPSNPKIEMFGPVHSACEGPPLQQPTVTFEPFEQ